MKLSIPVGVALLTAAAFAVPFDAKDQYVDTTGTHKFVAPGPLDARGPCPGLNAMANHGYLPHNGFATIPQFVQACTTVFRMGSELALLLAVYGAALDGPAAGWSIGGIPHLGIGGSHNNYESDSSPCRGDLYQYGSNTDLVMSQFQTLYDMQPDAATANYDINIMKRFRGHRFNESVAKNPYFYYAPFSGAIVTQAAFSFIYRFMSNKSSENPEGRLDKNVLKSFMSISGPEDNLVWTAGHERIPDNWYTRNSNDTYDVAGLGKDSSFFAKGQEYIETAGCNTGKVNTFTPVNVTSQASPDNLTKSPMCFGLEFALATASQASGSLIPVVPPVLEEAIQPIENLFGCTNVPDLKTDSGKACPGYSLWGGPIAKIAPGAIRN